MAKKYTVDELNTLSADSLKIIILSMQDQLEQLNQNMERLIEQMAAANNQRFGRSSEKLEVIDGQLGLDFIFNKAEALTETLYVVEPAEEDVLPTKKKKQVGKREKDLEGLPVQEIQHMLSEEQLNEIFGVNGWKQLPGEVFKRVKVEPAVYTVEEHHVAVYAGKDNQTIVKADRPKSLLRNSIATPSLVASVYNAKYVNGMPLERIHKEYLRNDIHISKQVLANWVIQCAERYLGIMFDYLQKELLTFRILQADETPVFVTKDGRPANSKSFMWVYRTGKCYKETPIILYEYQKTRKAAHPQEFLKDFHGTLVTDAYSVYDSMDRKNPDIVFAGCWAHGRRRFAEAIKAIPKEKRETAKDTIAYQALKQIAAIYHLDNELSDLSPEQRKQERQLTVKPLVEAFFAWAKDIKEQNCLSKSKTLDGIHYCLNHETNLKEFLNDGDLPLDNNATESALRTFCVHKHTWRLIDSVDGAKASAIVYSLTETAKANHLNPFRYLEFLLTELMEHQGDTNQNFLKDLLPWSEQIPEICKIKTTK